MFNWICVFFCNGSICYMGLLLQRLSIHGFMKMGIDMAGASIFSSFVLLEASSISYGLHIATCSSLPETVLLSSKVLISSKLTWNGTGNYIHLIEFWVYFYITEVGFYWIDEFFFSFFLFFLYQGQFSNTSCFHGCNSMLQFSISWKPSPLELERGCVCTAPPRRSIRTFVLLDT